MQDSEDASFYPSGKVMLQIISGVKRNDGIILVFEDADILKSVFFEYSGLIDMKINALDLIEHPSLYLIDPEKNMIAMKCGMDREVPCDTPKGPF
jgi:hypothetical protein